MKYVCVSLFCAFSGARTEQETEFSVKSPVSLRHIAHVDAQVLSQTSADDVIVSITFTPNFCRLLTVSRFFF